MSRLFLCLLLLYFALYFRSARKLFYGDFDGLRKFLKVSTVLLIVFLKRKAR
jgi:hypothetical protein